jgi:alkylation response protein AidB-like acyl-CoA dehydrogenase
VTHTAKAIRTTWVTQEGYLHFLAKELRMRENEKERQMIKEVAVKTAQKVVGPKVEEIDATGEFPWDLVETFGKQGLLSVLFPEEYGGTNGDLASFCLVIEEIAKVSGVASLLVLAQGVGAMPIVLAGNPSQQERYLTQIAENNSLATIALTEQGEGLETTFAKIRAEKKGDAYLLNGHQPFITHGSVAELYTVFASTDPHRKAEGISAFVVEKGTPGLRFGAKEETLGMKGAVMTDVIFEDCKIPQANRLGEEGKAWETAERTLTVSRLGAGAQALGIAQGAMDFAVHYAGERIQFGKPIFSFQAMQFMIADMATQVEAARALVYKAVAQLDAHVEGAENLAAMAKSFASDVAMKVTTDAVQILGGYGYMKDYPVERMMRDAKMTQIQSGSNQMQRLTVAQHLFQD